MLISRRAALVRGAALLTGLYVAGSAHAATTGVAYQLKPGTQCNCKACHHHAANKVFATRPAAQVDRAHPGCQCTVVTTQVDTAIWTALFGSAQHPARTAVDRRWTSTKRALKGAVLTPSRKPADHPIHQTLERRTHDTGRRRQRGKVRERSAHPRG